MKSLLSSIYVILGGILWGSMGIFVRGLSKCGLTSLEICAVRVSTSCLALAIILGIFNRRALCIKIRDIWCFVGTGVFSLTFFGYCYFTAIQMTSMAVAAVLLYTSPVFVLLMSAVIFREHITVRKIICIILAIAGCALVTGIAGSGLNLPILGILVGLGSGFGYALYSIFGRFALNRGYGSLTVSFYSFVFSTLALLFLVNPMTIISKIMSAGAGESALAGSGLAESGLAGSGLSEGALAGSGLLGNGIAGASLSGSASAMMYVLGLAVFATILPYIFYTKGLSGIDNSKAAVIACIEPITAAILGFAVFGELLSVVELTGIVMILVSIVMMG